jgi:hypothetical protein
MLLSEIETQRQAQGTARPPILPIPEMQGTREQGNKGTRTDQQTEVVK